MEEFIYIILIVIWLLVSFLKRRPKKQQPAGKPQQPAKESAPAGTEEASMEEMLEEFFGGGKKKKEAPKPEQEPVYKTADRTMRREKYERDDRWDRGRSDKRDYVEKTAEEVADKPSDEYKEKAGVSEEYEFAAEGNIQTIDDLIESHKKEEALRLAMEEETIDAELGEGIEAFDLRTAVIFSEILYRKYQ